MDRDISKSISSPHVEAFLTATFTSSANCSQKLGPRGFHPSFFALADSALLFEPHKYKERPGSSAVISPTCLGVHFTVLLSFGSQPCLMPNLLIASAASFLESKSAYDFRVGFRTPQIQTRKMERRAFYIPSNTIRNGKVEPLENVC